MDRIQIRPVKYGDDKFLTKLMNHPVLMNRLHQAETAEEDWKEAIQLWLQDLDEKGYIAEVDGNPAGWFAVNGLTERKPYIKIAVLFPEFQGRGIGTRVLSLLIEMLKEEGYGQVRLFVDRDNLHAIACYEGCNFQIVGAVTQKWPDGTVCEQLEMARKLLQEEQYETIRK